MLRKDKQSIAFTVTLCDVDLPAFISDGRIYIQAPLQELAHAFDTYFSKRRRNLAAGVPKARRPTLSPVDNGRAVHSEGMGESELV